MAVIVKLVLKGVTREQYGAVRTECGWLGQPPTGGLAHITWWEGEDCVSIDAWESEQAMEAFGEQRLGPAMAQVGVAVEPEMTFMSPEEVFLPRQLTIAPSAGPVIGADNVALIRAGYAAFAAGDIPAVLGLFDASIVWSAPDTVRFGGTYLGPAGVGEFFSKLPENYAELRVEPDRYVDRADSVVAVGHHRGRTHAGTSFEIPFVHVWTLSNGKATSFTEYFDTVKMNAVLGLPAQASVRIPEAAESRS
jgi:ketosteroid isomerase-like protein